MEQIPVNLNKNNEVPKEKRYKEIVEFMSSGIDRTRGVFEYFLSFGVDVDSLKGKKVLDVGAGAGNFVEDLRAEGIDAVALDPIYSDEYETRKMDMKNRLLDFKRIARTQGRDKAVQEYQEINKNDGVFKGKKRVAAMADAIPFKDESFDSIFNSFSSFTYAGSKEELERILEEELRIARSGGVIFIYPNPSRYNFYFKIGKGERDEMTEFFKIMLDDFEKEGKIIIEQNLPEGVLIIRKKD